MKKIYLLFAMAGFAFQGMAQTFVSTDVEKKNVVLEEFTGIRCTYCPDGHKRAQALKDANPGKVVLINIHTGSFATKRTAAEPDFTTSYGDNIGGQSTTTGYPSGTVNRKMFSTSQGGGTAMNRGDWAAAASQVLSQNSPVNVAIETSLDIENRELTIVAEVYYTGDAAESTNMLNIAILQNNLTSVQTGATNFWPEKVLPNGEYTHNHMLRDMVTGQWGEVMDETTEGSFFTQEYTYKIPADIKSNDVMLQFLEVAAFVTETTQEVLSGTVMAVEIPVESEGDLSLVDNTPALEGGICATSVSPSVTIKNEGTNDVTSFTVSATINGVDESKDFDGTLKAGESTDISRGEVTLPGGFYSIAIGSPSDINGGELLDTDFLNSLGASVSGYSFLSDAVKAGYQATFDDIVGNTIQYPSNLVVDRSQNGANSLYYSTQGVYGAKNTRGALRFNLDNTWQVTGRPANIMFGKVDLSAIENAGITYYYAYSDGGNFGTKPTIEVKISGDCGMSWTTVSTIEPNETGQPGNPQQFYLPASSEYVRIARNLDADYQNIKDALIMVSVVPGTDGNSLYLDEISLSSAPTGIETASNENSFSVYPNPFQNETSIAMELTSAADLDVKIYDALGRVVSTVASKEYAAGSYNVPVNTTNLDNGMYIVKIENNGTPVMQQVIIKE